jgi:group I intron endonuclease
MYHIVYQTTNLINGKFYIGKHSTKNLDDGYLGTGLLIKEAIKKYGKENFQRIVLYYCASSQEAYNIESLIVNKNFIKHEDTYNIILGGSGSFTEKNCSEETRKKMSESHKGHIPTEITRKKLSEKGKNRTHSEETKRKISQSHMKMYPTYETRKKLSESSKHRLPISDETRNKLSISMKGNKNRKRKIDNLSLSV